ncbi:MAG: hypothetical protein U0790_20785 [Isosphaeraceae bacterium]
MGATELPLLWAQAVGAAGGDPGSGTTAVTANPAALASLALRRWFSGQTLSSPQAIPDLHGLRALAAGLLALLILAVCFQGFATTVRQVLHLRAHVGLVRRATVRVWRAGRLVAAAITFTVVAWTGSQTLAFLTDRPEKGRADLTLLTRSRDTGELALDQGILAALTPLRDLAALADNLPLLLCAVYLVFRASSGTLPPLESAGVRPGERPASRASAHAGSLTGWSTLIWGCGALYLLYRLVARFLGSTDLPLGGCLVVEALLIPVMMAICDGFLLAWLLAELRNAGFEEGREDRSHPVLGLELMPAAVLGCVLVLPARYVGTLVWLTTQHLPTTVTATPLGQYIRWQLGWGLVDFQAGSLVFLGLIGVVAWSRGSVGEVVAGFGRLLRLEGGHLVVAVALAAAASCVLAAMIYPLILLLPPAGWVLPAADSYSHYLTLPAGLWTLAALIELAQRSLPVAQLARDEGEGPPSNGLSHGRDRAPEGDEVVAAEPSAAAPHRG